MIEFGHGTHIGLRRSRNEDTYYADASLGLFLVADGMGGHEHGEVASALARDAVVEHIAKGMELVEAIHGAGEVLLSHARNRQDIFPMGTTLAALRITSSGYEIAWVGDSRVYLHSDNLKQVSHDHSLVQKLVNAGRLDPALASQHPQRNILTQALGVTALEQLRIGMARGSVMPRSSFLLCTDGLNEGLDDAAIERLLKRRDLSPQECTEHLLLDALEGSGSDNITAIVVRAA